MRDLVRAKLGRRRRRRRTMAASAGGGVVAALVAVVVLVGAPGADQAGVDVKTGPGPGGTAVTTTTTTDGGERPAESSSTTTTTAPPMTAPDAGAGASGAGSTGRGGLSDDGSTTTAPPSTSAAPGGGGTGPGGSDPGSGSSPTTPPDDVAIPPTTTTPQPRVEVRTALSGDMRLTVTTTSNPHEPGRIHIRVQASDPTGTLVKGGERYGFSIGMGIDGTSQPWHYGDRYPSCYPGVEEDPYTVEPASFDRTFQIDAGPGGSIEIGVEAHNLTCYPEAAGATVSIRPQAY